MSFCEKYLWCWWHKRNNLKQKLYEAAWNANIGEKNSSVGGGALIPLFIPCAIVMQIFIKISL
jgi:hypothetical protein